MGLFRKKKEEEPRDFSYTEWLHSYLLSKDDGTTPVDITPQMPYLSRCDHCFAFVDSDKAAEHGRKCTDETTT